MTRRELRVGPLALTLSFNGEGHLCAVQIPVEVPENLDAATLREACSQLAAFPLCLEHGAPFARAVWEQMRAIPWGSALTYGELALQLGNPRAVRAVGQACGKNTLLLVVPCHRVLAQSGPGGFNLGLEWKHKLLELESE
jgi:O-6-methylguanine DNA methyltransferase